MRNHRPLSSDVTTDTVKFRKQLRHAVLFGALAVMLAIAAVAASQTFSTPTAEAQAPACVAEENRKTLVALYNATDGENWILQPPENWFVEGTTLTDRWRDSYWIPPATSGSVDVQFDIEGCVTYLQMWNNGLVGEVPNLDAFTRIAGIVLADNQLRGQFPSLAALTRLTHLNLSGNKLTGTVKSLGLAGLANLTGDINLSNNKFSGTVLGSAGTAAERDIPPSAEHSIWLFGNDFTGPIPDLSANTNMDSLNLSNNRFTELDTDRLPRVGGPGVNSQYIFRASHNEFSGEFPDFTATYHNFSTLNLSHNNFSGELDATHLKQWNQTISIGANDLHRINRISELDLSHNNFSGELPDLSDRIGGAATKLYLNNNNFSGEIDADHLITDPAASIKIDTLHLQNNNFSGAVPDLSSARGLRFLNISDNNFSDTTLNVDRFNKGTIAELSAANIGFTGPVPDFTGFTDRNLKVDLSGNHFTGMIADLNLNAGTLAYLDLSGNMLTGDLGIIGTFFNADVINLADNEFTGTLVLPIRNPLPYRPSEPYDIMDYIVSGNKLTGELPDFSARNTLNALVISNNMLSGKVDSAHFPQASLVRLEIDGNPDLDVSDVDFSVFTGLETLKFDLPANYDFTQLPASLPTLDLSGHSGPFPDFSKLTALTELVLYPANDFKGVVSSKNVPIDGALTRLVIGHTLDVPGEDPNNPDRMCADITDGAFREWVMRSDTTFVGAYCGQASGSSGGGGSVVRLARIEPGIGDVSVRAGDDVQLSLNIFGRQGAQDQSLADSATFMWSVGDDALAGTGSSISYTAPSSPGTYIVTASLPESQCHGLGDSAANCTATFEVQVLRSSPAPIPTAAPSDPPGVPEILADSDGNQYEVFTPVSGGSFNDGMVMLTADAGAVPNGEVIGLRVDAAGAASNAGMTHQRYTLAGDAYTVSAVDISGASVSDYRLNSPAQLCVPLPDALRANISDLAMLVHNPDGTLTVLSTTVHVSGNGVLGCGNISTVPATVALGTSGAPAAIPTATPEPTPIPPDTGGYTPTNTATPWLLLLLLGTITTAVASTLVLRRRRASSEV